MANLKKSLSVSRLPTSQSRISHCPSQKPPSPPSPPHVHPLPSSPSSRSPVSMKPNSSHISSPPRLAPPPTTATRTNTPSSTNAVRRSGHRRKNTSYEIFSSSSPSRTPSVIT